MTNVILLVLIAVAIFFAAAFLYVSRIISLPPEGRAVDYLNSKLRYYRGVQMKIIITGAIGHIGSYIIRDLGIKFPMAEIVMIDNMITQRFPSLINSSILSTCKEDVVAPVSTLMCKSSMPSSGREQCSSTPINNFVSVIVISFFSI